MPRVAGSPRRGERRCGEGSILPLFFPSRGFPLDLLGIASPVYPVLDALPRGAQHKLSSARKYIFSVAKYLADLMGHTGGVYSTCLQKASVGNLSGRHAPMARKLDEVSVLFVRVGSR